MNMSIYVIADYVVKQKKSKIYNVNNSINNNIFLKTYINEDKHELYA